MSTSPQFDTNHLKQNILKTDSAESYTTPRHLPAGASRDKFKVMRKQIYTAKAYVQLIESSDDAKIARNMASMLCDGYGQMAFSRPSFTEYGLDKNLITSNEFEMLKELRTPSLMKQLFDGTTIREDELFAELNREIDFVHNLVGTARLARLAEAIYSDASKVRQGAIHRALWLQHLNRLLIVSDMAWRRSYDPLTFPGSPAARADGAAADGDDPVSPFDSTPMAEDAALGVKSLATSSPAEGAPATSPFNADGVKVKSEPSSEFGAGGKVAELRGKVARAKLADESIDGIPEVAGGHVPPSTPLPAVAASASKASPAVAGASPPASAAFLESAINHLRNVEESVSEKFHEVDNALGQLATVCSPENIKRYVSAAIEKTSPAPSGTMLDADSLKTIVAALRGPNDSASAAPRSSSQPPYEPWMSASRVKGVSHAGSPDAAAAWAKRPKPGLTPAQEKAALHRLKEQHAPTKLLDLAPPPGRNDLYVEVRNTVYEGAYMYKHVLSSAADNDADLLSALLGCARSRMVGLEGHRWKPIVRATSVADFFSQLDQLYMNAADNTCELEWSEAERRAKTALDLFRHLRPLLKDVASCQRAKEALKARLAKLGPVAVSGMQALVQCPDDPAALSQWEAALAFSDNAISLVLEAQSDKEKLSGVSRRGGINALEGIGANLGANLGANGAEERGLNPLVNGQQRETMGFSSVLDTVSQLTEQEHVACANLVMTLRAKDQGVPPLAPYGTLTVGGAGNDAVTPQEADLIHKLLAERRTAGTSTARSFNGTNDKNTESSLHETLVDAHTRALNALHNGAFKPIYDLTRVYPFCGISVDSVPEAKAGAGAGAGKCKICDLLGVTILDYGKDVPTPLAKDTRFDHNPWKCGCIPRAVKKVANEKGASEEEVRSILTPLATAPWKA